MKLVLRLFQFYANRRRRIGVLNAVIRFVRNLRECIIKTLEIVFPEFLYAFNSVVGQNQETITGWKSHVFTLLDCKNKWCWQMCLLSELRRKNEIFLINKKRKEKKKRKRKPRRSRSKSPLFYHAVNLFLPTVFQVSRIAVFVFEYLHGNNCFVVYLW